MTTRTNIPGAPLPLAAQLLVTCRNAVLSARGLVAGNQIMDAKRQLATADDSVQRAIALLAAEGVEMPAGESRRPDLPLHLLDTPKKRRFLALMREAQEAAADVDEENGWVLPDGTPCGWAEKIGGDVLRLTIEIEGPKGRD